MSQSYNLANPAEDRELYARGNDCVLLFLYSKAVSEVIVMLRWRKF